MHGSGIKADDGLKEKFKEMKLGSIPFFKVEIKNENFVFKTSGQKTGSKEDDFKQMQQALEDKVACYIFFRDPTPNNDGKWVLSQYMPDSARVNSKMLYASSRAAIKNDFGSSSLSEDYFISDKDELTLQAFLKSRAKMDKNELMTFQEQAKDEATRGEILAMSDGFALTVADVPITVSKEANAALSSVKAKISNKAILLLNSKTQELLHDSKVTVKNAAMEDIQKVCMAQKEPRYVLHRYSHKFEGKTKDAMCALR
eukprot:jgi/Bigna1/91205/estExt_fgenesh1_pg.C_920066